MIASSTGCPLWTLGSRWTRATRHMIRALQLTPSSLTLLASPTLARWVFPTTPMQWHLYLFVTFSNGKSCLHCLVMDSLQLPEWQLIAGCILLWPSLCKPIHIVHHSMMQYALGCVMSFPALLSLTLSTAIWHHLLSLSYTLCL